jgi:hypothetical protein
VALALNYFCENMIPCKIAFEVIALFSLSQWACLLISLPVELGRAEAELAADLAGLSLIHRHIYVSGKARHA